jgi:hypothetical protein
MYSCVIGTAVECCKSVCVRVCVRASECVMNCMLGIPNSRSVLTGALRLVLGRQIPPDSRLASGIIFTALSMQILISYNVMYVTSDVMAPCGPGHHPNCPIESTVTNNINALNIFI